MKTGIKTIILTIFYILFFLILGFLIYRYMLPEFLNRISSNDQTIRVSSENRIYFYTDKSIFKTNPALDTIRIDEGPSQKVLSDIDLGEYSFDQQKNNLFLENILSNKREIWQLNFASNLSRKVIFTDTPGLENFTEFLRPKVSKDGKKMVFMAKNEKTSYLYLVETKNFKTIDNLTLNMALENVVDYEWGNESSQLFVLRKLDQKYFLDQIDLISRQSTAVYSGEDNIISFKLQGNNIYAMIAQEENNQKNINLYELIEQKFSRETFLNYPLMIKKFTPMSVSGKFLIAVQNETKNEGQVLQFSTLSDKFTELAPANNAVSPVLSLDEEEVAYWVKQDGISKFNLKTKKTNKILNSIADTGELLIWR